MMVMKFCSMQQEAQFPWLTDTVGFSETMEFRPTAYLHWKMSEKKQGIRKSREFMGNLLL